MAARKLAVSRITSFTLYAEDLDALNALQLAYGERSLSATLRRALREAQAHAPARANGHQPARAKKKRGGGK